MCLQCERGQPTCRYDVLRSLAVRERASGHQYGPWRPYLKTAVERISPPSPRDAHRYPTLIKSSRCDGDSVLAVRERASGHQYGPWRPYLKTAVDLVHVATDLDPLHPMCSWWPCSVHRGRRVVCDARGTVVVVVCTGDGAKRHGHGEDA